MYIYKNNTGLNNKAFTLIEALVVIVVIAVIATVATNRYINVSNDARNALVASVAASLEHGVRQYRTYWITRNSIGAGNTSRVDLVVDGISVRYRNGYVVNVNTSAHVPAGTPNRNAANTRIFHLFLITPPQPIIPRNSTETGWVMLANGDCAAVTRPRCWEYRVNGSRFARITYASGGNGEIIVD